MIEKMGNPFLDKDNDTYCLNSKVVMDPPVVHVVHCINNLSQGAVTL